MSTSPEISVIIPVYNSADYIAGALESVFSQTRSDYEVIVIDDGSTDGTADVVRSFPGVRLLEQNNRGPAAARNLGLEHSSGRLIAFLDADDLWLSEKLEIQCRYMESHPEVGLVYSDLSTFDEEGVRSVSYDSQHRTVYEGLVFDHLFLKNFIGTITVMARKQCFEKAGNFDERFKRSSDWHQWLRIAYYYKIGYINQPLARYRWNKESISFDSAKAYPDRLRVLKDTVDRFPGYFAGKRRLVRQATGGCLFRYGYVLFKEGRYRDACRKFALSIRQDPFQLKSYLYLSGLLIPEGARRRISAVKNKLGVRILPTE